MTPPRGSAELESSVPGWLAHVLRHHATLLAATLAIRNRLSRAATARSSIGMLAAIATVAAVVGFSIGGQGRAASALRWLLGVPVLVVCAAAWHAFSSTAARRRRLAAARARSWLAATPRSGHDSRASRALLAVLPLLGQWAAVSALALLTTVDTSVSAPQALRLGALLALGAAIGAAIAAALPLRAREPRHAGSRYASWLRRSAAAAPSADALARWPIAQTLAWSRPENARVLLLAAIVSVPGGTGALTGLLILVAWALCAYLTSLLAATAQLARAAALWLRPTPIGFWTFAWPLVRRVLAHQAAGTVVAVAGLVASGQPPASAVHTGAVWLGVVALVAAVSVADGYRARMPGMKALLAALVTLLAEQRAHGFGLAFAAAVTVWHLRLGASHARA